MLGVKLSTSRKIYLILTVVCVLFLTVGIWLMIVGANATGELIYRINRDMPPMDSFWSLELSVSLTVVSSSVSTAAAIGVGAFAYGLFKKN